MKPSEKRHTATRGGDAGVPGISFHKCSRSMVGATMVEFALIIALMAVVAIPSITTMRDPVQAAFCVAYEVFGGTGNQICNGNARYDALTREVQQN